MAPAYSSPSSEADNGKEHNSKTSYNARWGLIVGIVAAGLIAISIIACIVACFWRRRKIRRIRKQNQGTEDIDLEATSNTSDRPASPVSPAGAISRKVSQEDNGSIISRLKGRVGSLVPEPTIPAPANHRTQELPKPILKKPTPPNPDETAPAQRNVSLSTIFSSLFHVRSTHRDSSTNYTKSDSESEGESLKSCSSSELEQPAAPPTKPRLYGLFPRLYAGKTRDNSAVGEAKQDYDAESPRAFQFPRGTTAPATPVHDPPPRTSISSLFQIAATAHKSSPPASTNPRPSNDSSRHGFLPSIFSRRKQTSSATEYLETSPTTIQLQTPPATPDLLSPQRPHPSFISSIHKFLEAHVYRKGEVEPSQAEKTFWVDRVPQNSGSWTQRQEQMRGRPVDDGLRRLSLSPLSN